MQLGKLQCLTNGFDAARTGENDASEVIGRLQFASQLFQILETETECWHKYRIEAIGMQFLRVPVTTLWFGFENNHCAPSTHFFNSMSTKLDWLTIKWLLRWRVAMFSNFWYQQVAGSVCPFSLYVLVSGWVGGGRITNAVIIIFWSKIRTGLHRSAHKMTLCQKKVESKIYYCCSLLILFNKILRSIIIFLFANY